MPGDRNRVVFLLDVDNTLLDNDRVTADLKRYLFKSRRRRARRSGTGRFSRRCDPNWDTPTTWAPSSATGWSTRAIPTCSACRRSSSTIRSRTGCFPQSLDVVEHLGQWGPTVIFSDGDVVFQPRKVERSGLVRRGRSTASSSTSTRSMELDDVEARYPADHYVLVDDKVRILTAIKKVWGGRLTTVFPRQGHYAHDKSVADLPDPDVTIERIGDLLDWILDR